MQLRFPPCLLLASFLAACGGGGDEKGEPLIASTLTASYAGTTFTPINGYVTGLLPNTSKYYIVVGTDAIRCGSETASSPPPGYNAAFAVDALDVGTYSSYVQMYKNVGGYSGIGATGATVDITASTTTSITGQLTFAYTDPDNEMYSVSGTFEAIRCP